MQHYTNTITENQNESQLKHRQETNREDNKYCISGASTMSPEELIGAIRKKIQETI